MVQLDLTCLEFMDSAPVVGCPLSIRLVIAPRFLRIINIPIGPGVPKPIHKEVLIPDMSLAETLTARAVSDARGRASVQFDAAEKWTRVSGRSDDQGLRPKDVVGYVTTRAALRPLDLVTGHPVLLARAPQSVVSAVMVLDPAKVVLGWSTPTTARVLFQLHAAPSPGFAFVGLLGRGGQLVERRTVPIVSNAAHTGVLTFTGLTPGTTYSIALVGQDLADGTHTFLGRAELRTPVAEPARWTFGFTSCHRPTDAASLRPWARGAAREPADLMLLLGDQIYGDEVPKITPDSLPWFDRYVRRYNQLWAYQPMRDLLRRTPTVAIFDDHEVVDDWGVATEKEIGKARLTGAIDAYESLQDVLNPPGRATGVYDFAFRRGRVAGYVLDERSQRGGGGNRNVLGRTQLDRFRRWAEGGDARAADVILLGSSVPFAYLPTERLEDVGAVAATGAGAIAGALVGGVLFGPPGAVIGGFLGAAGSAITYDAVLEDIREPDLQDQWVHDRNQAELADLLDILFDLANDITDGVPGPRPRAVVILSGDVHVGGVHLIHSDRRGGGHDHRRNRLIYQLTGSPVSTANPDNGILNNLLDVLPEQVDLARAELLKDDPDREADAPLDVRRFILDSNGDEHYSTEFLAVLRERNMGRLQIEHAGARRYRFTVGITGSRDSLTAMFELDLDAPRVQPRDLVGQRLNTSGVPVFLLVHDFDAPFGPPEDRVAGEVVVRLDSEPGRSFGFPLRTGTGEPAHRGMLDLLRDAFTAGTVVSIDYDRTGPRNGSIVRVITLDL
jgi:hypothetical protein